jgi:hypothetical protein
MFINPISISPQGQTLYPVPSRFTEINYIQTDGSSSRLQLPIGGTTYHRITAEFELLTVKEAPLFGARSSATANRDVLFCPGSTNMVYQCGTNNVQTATSGVTFSTGVKYTVIAENGKITLNGTTYTGTAGTASGAWTYPVCSLFNLNQGTGQQSQFWHGKLYFLEIERKNPHGGQWRIEMYLVPVRRTSDNAYGLWDKITAHFATQNTLTGG